MNTYSSQVKHQLRDLAALALERELDLLLSEIAGHVEEWKMKTISSRELRHKLHTFVDGPSRELFNRYRRIEDERLVFDAVGRSILQKSDIPDDVFTAIKTRLGGVR